MNGVKQIIIFLIFFFIMLILNLGIYFLSRLLNPKEEQKHFASKNVVLYGGLVPVAFYLAMNLLSTCGKVLDGIEKDHLIQNIIFERGLAVVILISYFIVKIVAFSKGYNLKVKKFFPYKKEEIDGEEKYYIDEKYKKGGKELKRVAFILAILFSFGQAIFVYNNYYYFTISEFLYNYGYVITMCMIYLTVYEIGVFLDGEIHPQILENQNNIIKEDLFNQMITEYKDKFKDHLLLTLNKDESVSSDNGLNKDDYIYSKIFTPIIEGENMIIETENIYVLNDIIPPLINLIFGTNRKMMFITENDAESNATLKWLKDCNVITDNRNKSVQVFTEEGDRMMLPDNNIDICIGTVEQLLEHRDMTKGAETIFSINVDNIIVKSPVELSTLTKVLSRDKSKKVQYVLFANETNGLRQSIERVFYTEKFLYQVVRQKLVRNFYSMFYAKEKGWIQKEVLPAMAADSLGSVLPLLITPLKYGFENLYAISDSEPYSDEMTSLHKCAPNLKKYVGNTKVNDIEDKIKFLPNEHFTGNEDSMIVSYDDTENNLILLLKNYIKYASSRMLVNIVSDKYLLRDYMIDNIDFLMQNHEFLGKIVPFHKDGKKILLFKLINELCLNELEENYVVTELNRLNGHSFNPEDVDNAESYIKQSFTELIEEVFGKRIYMEGYVNKEFDSQVCGKKRYNYRLSDYIKDELPRNLFTQIKFVTADDRYKQLKRIPIYEMYQNYAVGQYVVFDGKSYKIDNINDRDGVVTLIYNDHMTSTTYRQKKDVKLVKILNVGKSENANNIDNLTYEKKILTVDAEVAYTGYYEFTFGLNFNQKFYKYQSNNLYGSLAVNKYPSQKAFLVSFSNDRINKFDDTQKLKIAETIAFLLNEIAKTIYHGANQYLIIRAITKNNVMLDGEVNDLYTPINMDSFDDDIGIMVMEDTELERGILDSFTLNFDTTILPLLIDYLEWVLEEDNNQAKSTQLERTKNTVQLDDIFVKTDNGDRINFYCDERLEYLKLGKEDVSSYFDLRNALLLLRALNINGDNSITVTRKEFLNRRSLVDNLEKKRAEREAKEKTEKEAKEKAEQLAKEKAEKAAKEQAEKEAKEKKENEEKAAKEKENKKEEENVKKIKQAEEQKKESTKMESSKSDVVSSNYEYTVGKGVTKEDVIEFLETKIYDPVINTEKNIGKLRNTVLLSKSRVNKDNWNVYSVVNYVLHSTESEQGKKMYKSLKSFDLPCFEDYLSEFMETFGVKKNK